MTRSEESSPTRRSQASLLPTPSQPRSDSDIPPSPPVSPHATPEALRHSPSPVGQRSQHPGLSPTPSTSSTATTSGDQSVQDEAESCGHPIHPAYSDTYISPQCPWCQLHECIVVARTPALTLTTRGGSESWRTLIVYGLGGEAQKREQKLARFVTGKYTRRDSRGRDLHVKKRKNGTEVSYPRGKTALLKKIAELEDICSGEIAWEKRNPEERRDAETQQQLVDAENFTARTALEHWQNTKKAFEKVEAQSAATSLKRGREMEIAARPDFPPPEDYFSGRVYHLNQQQRSFVDAVSPPNLVCATPTKDDSDDDDLSHPKRKRRCISATVAFNPHTYIRTETDIDILFAPPAALTAGFLENTPAAPPLQSILRTTLQHTHPPSQREYAVKALETREKCTAGVVVKTRFRSKKEGYERVDTSGWRYRGRWEEWDGYRGQLAAEAGETGDDEDKDEDMAETEHVDGEDIADEGCDDEGIEEDEFPTDEEVAEVERQIREVQWAKNEPPRAKFRPHGGMASVFALGSLVGEAAMDLVHRAGFL
ncbi:hypothetical protein SVAN01_11572 [Stagonosporopsis vannaccii]|nr:hypothetical protein SVAN01_11572 [Stagonosporopsis vannaccii]